MDRAWQQNIAGYSTDVVANIDSIAVLDIGNFRSGMIGGATAGTITFYACATPNGDYRLIEDSSSTDVSLTLTADRFAQIPAAVFSGARFIKIVHGASQVDYDLLLKT